MFHKAYKDICLWSKILFILQKYLAILQFQFHSELVPIILEQEKI